MVSKVSYSLVADADGVADASENQKVADLGVKINLEVADILQVSDTDTLYIMGNDGDIINLLDQDGAGGDEWVRTDVTDDFATYVYGANLATDRIRACRKRSQPPPPLRRRCRRTLRPMPRFERSAQLPAGC